MASSTGENEQALRRIMDMSRLISILALALHFYYYCYRVFEHWQLSWPIMDKILKQVEKTGLFSSFSKTKLAALLFLVISLLGAKGKKKQALSLAMPLGWMLAGLVVFTLASGLLHLPLPAATAAGSYMLCCTSGYLAILYGGSHLSRVIRQRINVDIFNADNESFPQQEQLLANPYSVNLKARYHHRGRTRASWINFINPFRGILVVGSPGSGKTYYVIRHIITQHIQKGFTMFLYDFKFDDLTRIAYNTWLEYKSGPGMAKHFYYINFDDLSRSHRCNPLEPASLIDISDAAESARTILMGLNREWIRRQGDFFVESPINFLTAIIWFLRCYQDGVFCTLPHVVELMQTPHAKLFSVLRTQKEIHVLINPFISAFLHQANQQLEGQIASAQISMARLSSPALYYILSGNDFSLDINSHSQPKIVCMGNNPQKLQTFGAVISLYISRIIKSVNQKGKQKSSLVFDEFPTVYLNHIDALIATARQNKVATTIGIQDLSQLRKDYGRELADVVMNITGNIICGQVTGETAKQLSERFGRINQDRTSLSINRTDTSISQSKQLDLAIPPSKIASLSAGEFVGMTSDNPDQTMLLKTFHCQLINNHDAIRKQEARYQPLPVVRQINASVIDANYLQIKEDIEGIIFSEMERMLNDPELSHLIISK
ncbi:conjugal transfer protein MobC [Dyadobacter pollutisoli]|uniref:YWFCY domain-containing protein n=1 Tax=Dyadobacter pollutisoli TaxID=2910158 RepID=A0A9E8SL62_9BACT|nr:conjugal transfer protein MobC [Dyadobacter pollutisoli]WAC13245.1 YWFCY domain-containing protein [Dyadobacter pollutisoli]